MMGDAPFALEATEAKRTSNKPHSASSTCPNAVRLSHLCGFDVGVSAPYFFCEGFDLFAGIGEIIMTGVAEHPKRSCFR